MARIATWNIYHRKWEYSESQERYDCYVIPRKQKLYLNFKERQSLRLKKPLFLYLYTTLKFWILKRKRIKIKPKNNRDIDSFLKTNLGEF